MSWGEAFALLIPAVALAYFWGYERGSNNGYPKGIADGVRRCREEYERTDKPEAE